jgi:acetyl-CoA C-acetyltransferase
MVTVAGYGITKFGELWQSDLRTLAFKAGMDAIKSTGIEPKDLDAIYVANMNSSLFAGQEHLGALITSLFNINVPAFRIEGACASGSLAINAAYLSLLSGKYQRVMVLGVEKMTDVEPAVAAQALAAAADEEWESYYGITFPSLYAMIAREHMRKFGTTREDLALISVKNHANGVLNPIAQFRKEITVDTVLNATMVADPLGLFDCSPISDGAAAVILSNTNTKPKTGQVQLLTSEIATSSLALHDRAEITTLDATVNAAAKAYLATGLTPKKIDIAEVHDCFTIAELLAYEDLGFVKKGKAVNLLRAGFFDRDGALPVNTSGGLKACGHPVGATGVKQAIEIYLQLSGLAGDRQVTHKLRHGLTQNVGGSGATCVVNIFKKV